MILPAGATMEWTHGLRPVRRSAFESAGDVKVTETGLGRPETTWAAGRYGEHGEDHARQRPAPDARGRRGRSARQPRHGSSRPARGRSQIRPVFVNDGLVELQAGRITATRSSRRRRRRWVRHPGTAASAYGAMTASASGALRPARGDFSTGASSPRRGTASTWSRRNTRSGAVPLHGAPRADTRRERASRSALVAAAAPRLRPGRPLAADDARRHLGRGRRDRRLARRSTTASGSSPVADGRGAATRQRRARARPVSSRPRAASARVTPPDAAHRPLLRARYLAARYRLVAPDGRRSRIATVTVRS